MKMKSFRDLFAEAEKDPAYWSERAILRVSEEIALAMERARVSRSELARRLGTSPAYVTKILRGNANFTLDTLARIARALGGEFHFHLAPLGAGTRWYDVYPGRWEAEIDWARAVARDVVSREVPVEWRALTSAVYATGMVQADEVREVSNGDAAAAA